MQAWSPVVVPATTQSFGPLRVFDSVSQELVTLDCDREVTMYVCGITPYDATHMGHAATYVAFDTLQRIWRACGATVNYTQNVTDVDDPLIERALATGRKWEDIAVEQTNLFRGDMEALRVIPPANYIGAVESIDLVVERVNELKAVDAVYDLDGDLYYDITKARLLGQIAHLTRDEMIAIFSQRGGDPHREGKRDPLDALLWRHERPDDPSWPTELGAGRPGWHIECAAIALKYLGKTIDVQGGGSDLKFPHHEMSAAHAETATGEQPFAQAFMHTGMVALNGEKMSKSLGNLVFVSQLTASGVDPMAIRLTILNNHYRTEWEWFESSLDTSVARLERWRDALAQPAGAADITAEIGNALINDLDTPRAIGLIDEWAHATLNGDTTDPSSPLTLAVTIDALLGIA
jgi:L-cysteine:1D-myo-inositol 2-amino-2-deoxy-alpha-D-glucopyranoside ligase